MAKQTTEKKDDGLITITAYGRQKGVSHTAVNRAIEAGRIVKGVVRLANGTKRINPKIADKEWIENTNPDHWRTKYSTQGGRNATEVDPEASKAEGNASLNAAKRAKAILDAKMAELDYRKKAGELVEKKKVYETLYTWGKELRNELLQVPDRVIDEVLGAPGRNEALTRLYDELAAVLDKLTKNEGREIVVDRK